MKHLGDIHCRIETIVIDIDHYMDLYHTLAFEAAVYEIYVI